MATIDRLDAEILIRLSVNARIGIAELAAELGVSRATAQLRLKRLEDEGILLGFRPIIDLAAIGMPIRAVITLDVDQRRVGAIVDGLRALPEVLEVRIQAGAVDLHVAVALESLAALQDLTSAIVQIEGVRKSVSTFTVSMPLQYRVEPLLHKITADAGWGRSTPSPNADSTPGSNPRSRQSRGR